MGLFQTSLLDLIDESGRSEGASRWDVPSPVRHSDGGTQLQMGQMKIF